MPPRSIDRTFYEHLRDAFIHLIISTLPSEARNHLLYLTPPPDILEYGCWCFRPNEPSLHDYTNCPNIKEGPYPNIVESGSRPLQCNHVTLKGLASRKHNLFCFDPVESAEIFINWFMQPSPILDGHDGLLRKQREDIQERLSQYEALCPDSASKGHREEKLDVLYRLLRDLRARDLPYEARMGHGSWHVERVRAVLGWQNKSFDECLGNLSWAMKEIGAGTLHVESARARARKRALDEAMKRAREEESIGWGQELRAREDVDRRAREEARRVEADRITRREEAYRRAREEARREAAARRIREEARREEAREEARREEAREEARRETARRRARYDAERRAREDEDRPHYRSRGHSRRR